ncbi:MAG: CBS domain-containing protein [Methanosphaera sp.]|nr:CBS domain-containing protein [Methanosphaera sp.]
MLTTVQKEILQSLINLYRQSKCTSVKCENIADLMGRNAGTIRNQMQSLRSLGLVQGVPGPRGGYKPTLEAYHTLNIENDPCEIMIPIKVNGVNISDISVNKIEFTSILRPGNCEATISVLGDIKQLDLNDIIQVGPTPVNNLTVIGRIIGRDDVDNVLLIRTESIQSIPNMKLKDVATKDVVTLTSNMNVLDILNTLHENKIKSAPVIDEGQIQGVVTYIDVLGCIKNSQIDSTAKDIMHIDITKAKESISLFNGITLIKQNEGSALLLVDSDDKLSGVVTSTDIIEKIVITT